MIVLPLQLIIFLLRSLCRDYITSQFRRSPRVNELPLALLRLLHYITP